jgi:hypothetical protein
MEAAARGNVALEQQPSVVEEAMLWLAVGMLGTRP